jgi:hypothetical protein
MFCINIYQAMRRTFHQQLHWYILGIDGKLVYVADSLGNKIPDFSNAGYKGGGVTIPYVPVKAIVWPLREIIQIKYKKL